MIGMLALGLTVICLVGRVSAFMKDRFPSPPPVGYHGPLLRKDEWGIEHRDHYFFSPYVNGCGCVSCEQVRSEKWLADRFPELVAFVKQNTQAK